MDWTLQFSATTRALRERLDNKSREEYVTEVTNVTMIFRLNHVPGTPVGDA